MNTRFKIDLMFALADMDQWPWKEGKHLNGQDVYVVSVAFYDLLRALLLEEKSRK